MVPDDVSTRKKILDCVTRLLFVASGDEITTRRIAEEAGVNVAAINYHFGSKDELIDQAVAAASGEAFEKGLKILLSMDRPPRERLREFLQGYAFGLMKFPGMTRTAFSTFFANGGRAGIYARYFKEMLEKIGEVIAEARGSAAGIQEGSSALAVLSVVMFPFLVPDAIKAAGGIDYADDAARNHYIETMLTFLVG